MLTAFQALILGVVEGFTEFLPISSTAHLILAAGALGISQSDFTKTFEIAIQSGAILAVVALYWRKFLDIGVFKKIVVAFIPTGIIGLLFYKLVKTYLIGNTTVVLAALALGGVVLILFERSFKESTDASVGIDGMSYRTAFGVGLFQSLAIVPGVSRAAATILGGMLLGVRRTAIVEFSFLLAVPTMLAATGLDLVKNLHEFSSAEFGTLALGGVASFITALIGITFLLRYVRTHSFTGFGVYRIALVILVLLGMLFR